MKGILVLIFFLLSIFKSNAQSYTLTTPVSGLNSPVAFTFTPDGKYLITLKSGTIRVHDPGGSFLNDFYDLSDSTYNSAERGLLGITIDPNYSSNKYVYAYYNHRYPVSSGPQAIRVVRFTDVNNTGTNPTILLDIPVSNSITGIHVGGNVRFRPSEPNKLYVTIGELGIPSNAQTLTNPFGKFLRINSDGTIPTDNPFYDDGDPSTGNDDRIWTYGHRNPFDFNFGTNDSLYSSENGEDAWDEVNIISKGQNYGWKDCEGNYVFGSFSTLCDNSFPSHIEPIHVFGAPLPAVTGVLFYSGTVMPEFDNHLLVADNNNGMITDLTLGSPGFTTITNSSTFQDLESLTTLMQGSDGCIYAMKGGYTSSGNITKICPQALGATENSEHGVAFSTSPNPFSELAFINYDLQNKGHVTITLHDITGRKIAELVNDMRAEGRHSEKLDAIQQQLPPGAYFIRLEVNKGEFIRTSKLMLVK